MANLIFIVNRTADDIDTLNEVADKVKTYNATQEEHDLYYNQMGTGLKGTITRGDIFFRYYDIFNEIENKAADKGITLTYPYAISNFKLISMGSGPSEVKAAMDGLLTDGNYLATLMGGTMPSNLLSYANVNQFETTLQQIYNSYVNAIPKPTQLSVTYTFDKTRHYNGYTTPEHVSMEGANSGFDKGVYTATYTPDDGYNWIDGTTTPITVTLTISVRYITIPIVIDAFYDNGNLVYPTVFGMDGNYVIQGGEGSGRDIGTYTIAFYLTDKYNTKWTDGSIDDLYINWHISDKVSVPVVESNLTYNGNPQSPTISSYDQSIISATYSSQIDAGSYYVVFHLLNSLYFWSDGTTADKSVEWNIAKANSSMTNPTAKLLDYTGSAQTLVNAGSASGGTIYYGLGSSTTSAPSSWSTSLPTGTNVGNYYVWSKVVGDSNHNDVAPTYACTVNIPVPKRVGGRIFYDDGSNGATYIFFDVNYNKLTTQTVAGLANAYYYTVIGTPTKDRWYVYDTSTRTDPYSGYEVNNGMLAHNNRGYVYWGWYGTQVGSANVPPYRTREIGDGKRNTEAVFATGIPTDYTPNIWGYIKRMRDDNYNGCNDWFILSTKEQDALRAANLVDWYSSTYTYVKYFWASSEYSKNTVYNWSIQGQSWYVGSKNQETMGCFAARAF